MPINKEVVSMKVLLTALGELCPECQSRLRENLANQAPAIEVARRQHLTEILANTAQEFGIAVEAVLGPEQHRELVRVRREVALRARQFGYSFSAIGGLLRRHHTSILSLVKEHQ